METLTFDKQMQLLAVALLLFWLLLKAIKWMTLKAKQEECQHLNKFTHVQSAYATCEETTETCLDCGKLLNHELDCR